MNLGFTRERTHARGRAKTSFAPAMFPDISLFSTQYFRDPVSLLGELSGVEVSDDGFGGTPAGRQRPVD